MLANDVALDKLAEIRPLIGLALWDRIFIIYPSFGRDVENRDYMKLSWERRRVDLDDLRAPDGHVVTGVTFQKLGEHLNMEIQVCTLYSWASKVGRTGGHVPPIKISGGTSPPKIRMKISNSDYFNGFKLDPFKFHRIFLLSW